jgi:hypothetical protein
MIDLIWFDFWCFNTTFNNISAISWRPVLVVEEAGVPGENHRPWVNNWLTLSLAAARRVHPFCNLQSRARTQSINCAQLFNNIQTIRQAMKVQTGLSEVDKYLYCSTLVYSQRWEMTPRNMFNLHARKKNWKFNWLIDWFDFWCFNANFNNISAISWRPVLVVEEAGITLWNGFGFYHMTKDNICFISN